MAFLFTSLMELKKKKILCFSYGISNLLSRIKLCYRYNIVHSFYQPLLGGAAFIQSKVQNSMFEELRKEKVKNERQSKHSE